MFLTKLHTEDKIPCLKYMTLYTLNKSIKTIWIDVIIISIAIIIEIFFGSFGITIGEFILLFFILISISFLMRFTDVFINNNRVFKQWDYGKGIDNLHNVLSPQTVLSQRKFMETHFKKNSINLNRDAGQVWIRKFIGVDLTKYKKASRRNNQVDSLL